MSELGLGARLDSRLRQERKRYTLGFLLLLSLILLIVSRHSAEASVFQKARDNVADVAAPLLEVLSGPIQSFNRVWGSVEDYFGVIEENRRLKEERADLLRWRARAVMLEGLIADYEALLNKEPDPPVEYLTAKVIGEIDGPFVDSMIVNVGRRQNINPGQAVVDAYGLIGRVLSSGERASRVLLLSDLNSKIPVYIEGADEQAILSGRNEGAPILEFVDAVDVSAFQQGQRIVTSGKGGVLPRGLPVGVISSTGGEAATVALYSNFDRTEFVRVLQYDFPTEVQPGETEVGADSEDEAAEETGEAAQENTVTERPAPPVETPATPIVENAPTATRPVAANAAPEPAPTSRQTEEAAAAVAAALEAETDAPSVGDPAPQTTGNALFATTPSAPPASGVGTPRASDGAPEEGGG